MSELEEAREGRLAPYERGIDGGEVVKATLGRFMPASILGAVVSVIVMSGGSIPSELIFLPLMVLPLGVGFGSGLGVLSRFLYPDANLNGSRSVVAGIMSPLAFGLIMLLAQQVLAVGPGFGLIALFLAGVVSAVIMFFAWLTPTPEEMRADCWIEAGAEESRAIPDPSQLERSAKARVLSPLLRTLKTPLAQLLWNTRAASLPERGRLRGRSEVVLQSQ